MTYFQENIVNSREQVVTLPEYIPVERPPLSEREREPIRRTNTRIMQKAGLGPVGARFNQRKATSASKLHSRYHRRTPYDK